MPGLERGNFALSFFRRLKLNIYVGNLSFKAQEQEISELFTPFGSVSSAKIITHRDSGRSRGFGFVEMESNDEANAAIEELNGKEFQGRTLVVNEARPKE